MKILFLSPWFPNRYDPMPGLFVKQHAEAVALDNEIAVLYVHSCDCEVVEVEKSTINGVFTIVVYYPAVRIHFPGVELLKAFRFIKAHWLGYKMLRNDFGKPHLIHVNILTRCGVVALLTKMLYSIPYVITEHWSRYLPSRNEYKGIIRKILTRLVVKRSEGIVTVSEALKTAMVNCGLEHKNFRVIHNSVDTSKFKPAEKKQHPKKIFSHISCFDDAAKNISGILSAVKVLSESRNDFEFHLIGEGPDFDKIVALSNSLGITGRFVVFKGLLEGQNLIEAYQNSLFTVLFSNYENMPVVVVESFACGVPVIATHVGGLPEIVNAETGILVKAGDESALVDALNYILNNYMQYNSDTIRFFAEQKFSTNVFREAYDEFYKSLQKLNKQRL